MTDLTDKKLVRFIQHELPGLAAGDYRFVVEQDLNGHESLPGPMGAKTYSYLVQAPRFQLNPANIHSVYPPENSEGNFMTVLPHVVLNHPSLPWMRSPLNGPVKKESASGVDLDVPTWLAVLLLQEDDFDNPDDLRVKTVKVKDLYQAALGEKGISQFSGTSDNEEQCQVIDIPAALFLEIAPSMEDLHMMAHLREVSLEFKPIQPEDRPAETGTFATIIGNRLPEKDKRATALLVSLEGMEKFLPDIDGNPPQSLDVEGKFVRLICFKSWNFTATSSSFGFENSFKKLNGGTAIDLENLNHPRLHLALNTSTAPEKIRQALELGYVPVNHTTRLGSKTVAWYRGPLSPYPIEEKTIDFIEASQQVIDSADELLRFDPSIGMFDISYSAAWQLGRLLAIQDRQFSSVLYKWKREMEQEFIIGLEREVLQSWVAPLLNELDVAGTVSAETPGSKTIFEQTIRLLKDLLNEEDDS